MSSTDMEDVQDPFVLFQQLERNLTAASTKMEKLAQEQKNQCVTIKDAAEKASQTAIDASEAFAVSKPRLMIWTAICAALLVSGGWIAGYWLGHRDGWATGHDVGREAALDANAAASWANTRSGIAGKRLDDAGSLQSLASCSVEGFTAETDDKGGHWCLIRGDDGKTRGWRTH